MDINQLKEETEKFMAQNKPNLPSNFKGNEKVHRAIRDMEKDLNDEEAQQSFQIDLKVLFELAQTEEGPKQDPPLGKHGYKFSDYLLEWKANPSNPNLFKLFLTNRKLEQSRTLQTCPGDYLQQMGPLLATFVEEMVRQNTRI